MTLKASPSKMTTMQTVAVLLVGASAVAWAAFGVMDYNIFTELSAYPTVQTGAYAATGVVGAVFLIEIFTETEILEIID